MKILIAPDKFKGSLTASQAAEAIQCGFHEVIPDAVFDLTPIADGGEGTVEVFLSQDRAQPRRVACSDALGQSLMADYAWLPDERLAVIGMSSASGLAIIPEGKRDILRSTTFGTGQLIRDALSLEPETLAIGLGGSATNDAGAGMASA
ncbi:MAG: glycerate kinase, partial [Terrimicrobiaceae bacterium]